MYIEISLNLGIDYFNFQYMVSSSDIENIPTEGRVLIVANHPLGGLDALALIKLVSEVRKDVKIVANDMLSSIEQIRELLLPIDNINQKYTKSSIRAIYDTLNRDEVVIIFPSGEVSRAKTTGIKDLKWHSGFLSFAQKSKSPILPIFIKARNSIPFYFFSSISRKASSIFLVDEMFKQRDKSLSFSIGQMIPYENLNLMGVEKRAITKLLQKHLIRIAKGKKGIFQTQKAIAHPENRQELRRELKEKCKLIGNSRDNKDNKEIYLYEYKDSTIILKELGRLREITFRKTGAGSGKKRDKDSYDFYYKHIILWDEKDLEIAGSYRIADVSEIIAKFGEKGLYTSTLFNYKENFKPYLQNSIELGRSFVQPKYWGSRALDNLWYGIGAYLREYPHIKYMFGTVTLSNSYPLYAQELIIGFYQKFFGVDEVVEANDRFILQENEFFQNEYRESLGELKRKLKEMDSTIPTLFKQYTELCEEDGIQFLDFGIDRDFNDAIDGFILVHVDKIKETKRKRYIS
jgi:putative hemolysin